MNYLISDGRGFKAQVFRFCCSVRIFHIRDTSSNSSIILRRI